MATIVSWPLVETIISLFITNSRPGGAGEAGSAGWEFRPACPACPTAYPALLVRESAHPDVEHEPEPGERGDHRRSAVAHERECQSFDRRQSCRHGDVVDHLEGEAGEH